MSEEPETEKSGEQICELLYPVFIFALQEAVCSVRHNFSALSLLQVARGIDALHSRLHPTHTPFTKQASLLGYTHKEFTDCIGRHPFSEEETQRWVLPTRCHAEIGKPENLEAENELRSQADFLQVFLGVLKSELQGDDGSHAADTESSRSTAGEGGEDAGEGGGSGENPPHPPHVSHSCDGRTDGFSCIRVTRLGDCTDPAAAIRRLLGGGDLASDDPTLAKIDINTPTTDPNPGGDPGTDKKTRKRRTPGKPAGRGKR